MFLLLLIFTSTLTTCPATQHSGQGGPYILRVKGQSQSNLGSGMTSHGHGIGNETIEEYELFDYDDEYVDDYWDKSRSGIDLGVEEKGSREIHINYHIHEQVWSDGTETCIAAGKACIPGTSLCCDPDSGDGKKKLCNKTLKKCVKGYPSLGDECRHEFDVCKKTGIKNRENEIICLSQKGDANNLICEERNCISEVGRECDVYYKEDGKYKKQSCCKKLTCVNDKCKDCKHGGGECGRCAKPGQQCFSRGGCCDSDNNVCRQVRKYDPGSNTLPGDCGPCAPSAHHCKKSEDCCNKKDRCAGNSKNGESRYCLTCGTSGVTHTCNGHDDCCPSQKCKSGRCKTCVLRGKPCTASDECCPAAPMCRAGVCNTCIAPNAFLDTVDKTYARYGCEKASDCCFVGNSCFTYHGGHKGCVWPKGCLPQSNPAAFKHKHCTFADKCCPGCECKTSEGKLFYKGTYCDCTRRG